MGRVISRKFLYGINFYKVKTFFLVNKHFNSPVQRILQCFLPSAILSLDTENGDPLFLNVMFAQMISEL